MVTKSTFTQSLKHAALGGSIFGAGVLVHQLVVKQAIEKALISGLGQSITSFINGLINLRIYNFVKTKLYELGLDNKKAKFGLAITSGLETFTVIYFANLWFGSKDPLSIALTYGFITTFFLPSAYEKIFLENK